ncbi:MAG: GIY-YIG nuclease family protein [Kiritimatiellia bacterium]
MSYSDYGLWSPLGRYFYIGVTHDVARRLAQHNQASPSGPAARRRQG